MDATQTYTVILEPQPEGGFTVTVPALPEVVTQAETEQEALARAAEAIELALEYRLAEGLEIPQAQTPQIRKVKVAIPIVA